MTSNSNINIYYSKKVGIELFIHQCQADIGLLIIHPAVDTLNSNS